MSYRRAHAHPAWAGDSASYSAVHTWMLRNYPKVGRCEWCGAVRKTDFAQTRAELSRNWADWLELCRPCHMRFDGTPAKHSEAMKGRTGWRTSMTHCPKGHPLSGDNLVPSMLAHGKRRCKTCANETSKRWKAAKRAAKNRTTS